MKDILGVIMCGGESKRMGTDKGLMRMGISIRARFVADKLSFLKCPLVFSINKTQLENYRNYISPADLVIDDNDLKGPARGLLTIHNRFPENDILLLACDMLNLDESTIQHLIQVYHIEGSYDYYVFQDEQYAQPFCGIYTARGIDKLKKYIISYTLTNISMQHILNNGLTKRLPIQNKKAFTNFNNS